MTTNTDYKNKVKERILEECRLIGLCVKYGTPEGDDQVYDAVEEHLDNIRKLLETKQ